MALATQVFMPEISFTFQKLANLDKILKTDQSVMATGQFQTGLSIGQYLQTARPGTVVPVLQRSFRRYLAFSVIELFIVLAIWQLVVEIADYMFGSSRRFRLLIYTMLLLFAITVMSLVYDEELDGST